MLHQRLQGQRVTVAFKAHNLADAAGRGQAFVADFLAGVSVAQMNLHRRNHVGYRLDGIGHAKAGMGQCGGVDDDSVKRPRASRRYG